MGSADEREIEQVNFCKQSASSFLHRLQLATAPLFEKIKEQHGNIELKAQRIEDNNAIFERLLNAETI